MLTRAQVVTLHLSLALMTATGVVFAFMKYWMKAADEFAVVNHPLQPWMLAAHVVLAPVAVFAFGWIFAPHIVPGINGPALPRRASGLWSVALLAPMILSGYLLQVSTADATRHAMAVAHWISSGLFVLGYCVHLATRKV